MKIQMNSISARGEPAVRTFFRLAARNFEKFAFVMRSKIHVDYFKRCSIINLRPIFFIKAELCVLSQTVKHPEADIIKLIFWHTNFQKPDS